MTNTSVSYYSVITVSHSVLCVIMIMFSIFTKSDEHISQLESDIARAQEAALEAAETDSVITGTSFNPDDMSFQGLFLYYV